MQLERRFDWKNTDIVYRRVNEDKDIEASKAGMVFFTATSTEGKAFKGKAFENTVAQMVDTPSGYWKLELGAPNKEGKVYSIVVPCTEAGTKFLKGKKQ